MCIRDRTGAGKTTLLRTIAGLDRVDAGAIALGGEEVTHAAPAQRDVSLVFQNFSLYPDWSVRRNLEFPLRAPGRTETTTQIRERVESTAAMLQISHLLPRMSSRLSGGEMQRVAIGRAIVRRPQLFLMDEPLTNLDAKLRESLRTELVLLRRKLKTPMIYGTHDQAEALSMHSWDMRMAFDNWCLRFFYSNHLFYRRQYLGRFRLRFFRCTFFTGFGLLLLFTLIEPLCYFTFSKSAAMFF